MKKSKLYLTGLLLSFAVAGGAQATTLADLIGGTTITDGADTFGGFKDLGVTSIGTTSTPNYALIDVAATGTGGLLFTANNQLTATGDAQGSYGFLDMFFAFSVTVANLADAPNTVDLSITASGVVSSPVDNGAWITEQVGTTLASVSAVGPMATQAQLSSDLLANGNIISDLTGTATFAAQNTIWVSKNILVWSDGTNTASLDSFTQQFSQVSTQVPEPNGLLLMAAGLFGFAARAKRRKSV